MSIPRPIVIAVALCLLLMVVPACKRSGVEEPNPFGPATRQVSMDVNVNPDVILTTDARQTSEVRALVKMGGEPAADQLIVFTIIRGPGEFEDYHVRTAATTNSNGYAFVTYLSPTKHQMSGDETVIIQAQLQTCSPYFVWHTVEIYLLQGE